jgi:release factor glutamine methyltransferase
MTAEAEFPTLSQPAAVEATVASSIALAAGRLQAVTSTPRLEAELLLALVLESSRAHLYTYPERALLSRELSTYHGLLDRRALGEPLPYLTGRCEF